MSGRRRVCRAHDRWTDRRRRGGGPPGTAAVPPAGGGGSDGLDRSLGVAPAPRGTRGGEREDGDAHPSESHRSEPLLQTDGEPRTPAAAHGVTAWAT